MAMLQQGYKSLIFGWVMVGVVWRTTEFALVSTGVNDGLQ